MMWRWLLLQISGWKFVSCPFLSYKLESGGRLAAWQHHLIHNYICSMPIFTKFNRLSILVANHQLFLFDFKNLQHLPTYGTSIAVNVWYPLVPTAYASLLVSVTCCGWFCELLCSLWFFSGCIWLRSASIGFLPILALLRYWTADIWLLQQWCYGVAFKPLVDMHF